MREDYEEQLDKMFPRGYVIIYTNPDCSVRVNMYNPEGHECLTEHRDRAMEVGDGQ